MVKKYFNFKGRKYSWVYRLVSCICFFETFTSPVPWIFQLKQPPAVGVIIDACVSDQEWWIIWPLICSLRSLFTILQQVTARQHFSNLQCFGSSGWPFSLRLPGGFLQYSWKALRLSFATIIAGFCHFLENLCGVSIKSVMYNLTTCLPETIERTHSAVSEGPPEQGIRKRVSVVAGGIQTFPVRLQWAA